MGLKFEGSEDNAPFDKVYNYTDPDEAFCDLVFSVS